MPSETHQETEAYLWRIWDILQMWRKDDHQWSSDEIEDVAGVMTDWVGEDWRDTLPPEPARRQDEESYIGYCSMDDCDNWLVDGIHTTETGEEICWVCAQEMPEEGDYVVDHRNGVSVYGEQFLGYYPNPDRFILEHQQQLQFFPDTWTLSDHGNFHRRELEE